MEEMEQRRKSSMLYQLIDVRREDVTLKFVFDHVRNYGLAASVMVAGFYLFKHGAVVNQFPGAGVVFGTLLIFTALLLVALNLGQAIWALIKLKIPTVLYFLFSLIIFLGASELTWVLIKQLGQRA